jgi:hypothetical protein
LGEDYYRRIRLGNGRKYVGEDGKNEGDKDEKEGESGNGMGISTFITFWKKISRFTLQTWTLKHAGSSMSSEINEE